MLRARLRYCFPRMITYAVEELAVTIDPTGTGPLEFGPPVLLSDTNSDIATACSWYGEGWTSIQGFDDFEHSRLVNGLTKTVAHLVSESGSHRRLERLEDYHNCVDERQHQGVVSRSRDLFPADFDLDTSELIERLSALVGLRLSDVDPVSGHQMHIIVRINRPSSHDFNPPHKDVYELVDSAEMRSSFMNFWIPICGVTQRSSLPIVPRSHLIGEDEICRSRSGAVVNGNRYRVRLVASWGGHQSLVRAPVSKGEVLAFSGHLIHGLAVNAEPDTTRVALEFRLYRK